MVLGLDLDRTVGALLEAAETSPDVALEPIIQALSGTYSVLFRMDRAGAVAEATCQGVDTGYGVRLKEAARLHLLPPWLDDLEAGSVVDRAAYGSDGQFARTAFFNHVVRPEGTFHCMIATPFASGAERYHLVVGRPHRRSEFDANSRRVLRWMLPQVAEILRLRVDLAATRLDLSQAERALDAVRQPVIIVAPGAVVLSANCAGRRLVALRDTLCLDARHRLAAATVPATTRLRHAVRLVATEGGTHEMVLPNGDATPPLVLTLSRLAEACGADGGKVMITSEPSESRDDEQRVADLARSFGLTRREADIVTALARGTTLKAAAAELGMSYNTARSYMRQVFEKTSVHRQGDLLRLVATGHRPPDRPSS